MPNWTRMTPPAAGAFSATWITRIGGLVFALILAGAFLVQSCFSTVPTDPESLHRARGDRRRLVPGRNSARACKTLSNARHWTRQRPSGNLPPSGAALGGAQRHARLSMRRPARRPCRGRHRPTDRRPRPNSAKSYGLKPSNGAPGRCAPRRLRSPTDARRPAGYARQRRPPRPSPPRTRWPRPTRPLTRAARVLLSPPNP